MDSENQEHDHEYEQDQGEEYYEVAIELSMKLGAPSIFAIVTPDLESKIVSVATENVNNEFDLEFVRNNSFVQTSNMETITFTPPSSSNDVNLESLIDEEYNSKVPIELRSEVPRSIFEQAIYFDMMTANFVKNGLKFDTETGKSTSDEGGLLGVVRAYAGIPGQTPEGKLAVKMLIWLE